MILTSPHPESPLGGFLGARTCSIFRLDPTGTVPIEPLIDILPGYSPLRVTYDLVDNESYTCDYDTTEHSIQSVLEITSHVRKRLRSISIVGRLTPLPPPFVTSGSGVLPGLPIPIGAGLDAPNVAPTPPGLRLDLVCFRNLEAIADSKRPVMVITPRVGLAKAIITSLSQLWTPKDGESIVVSISVREARLVSPITGDVVAPDFPSQAPGNNASTGGGTQAPSTVPSSATPSTTPGVSPSMNQRIVA